MAQNLVGNSEGVKDGERKFYILPRSRKSIPRGMRFTHLDKAEDLPCHLADKLRVGLTHGDFGENDV